VRRGATRRRARRRRPPGTQPVETKAGGIPSGFAHDQQGAQSAAANYSVVLVSADILKPARRGEIVQQVFVADKVSALQDKLNKAYDKAFLRQGRPGRERHRTDGQHVRLTHDAGRHQGHELLGQRPPSRSGARACSGWRGDSTNPVTNDWFTMTLQLRWADGDWKVDTFSQKDGPAPVNGDNKVSPPPTRSRRPSRSTEGSRMPGSPHRVRKVTAALAAVQTAVVLLATRAAAAPTPTPTPSADNCGLLSGPGQEDTARATPAAAADPGPAPPSPTPSTPSPPSPRAAPKPPPGPSTSSVTPSRTRRPSTSRTPRSSSSTRSSSPRRRSSPSSCGCSRSPSEPCEASPSVRPSARPSASSG
jgi:hypothetical protein